MTILCSLLNTTMNSSQSSSATVIGGVADRLPYNHLVFKGEDPRANLVGICFQSLCAVLNFRSGSARDVPTAYSQGCAPALKTNAFRYFLAKVVHRDTRICLELSSGDLSSIGPGSSRSSSTAFSVYQNSRWHPSTTCFRDREDPSHISQTPMSATGHFMGHDLTEV